MKTEVEVIEPVRGHLTDHQIQAIGRMAAMGSPLSIIAACVGKKPRTVAAWLSPEAGDERVLAAKAHYESRLLDHQSMFYYQMMDRKDRAFAAIDEGLAPSTDLRIRLETARDVFNHIKPPKVQEMAVTGPGGSVEAVTEVAGFLKEATGLLRDIRKDGSVDFSRSVVQGKDAIKNIVEVQVSRDPVPEEVEMELFSGEDS